MQSSIDPGKLDLERLTWHLFPCFPAGEVPPKVNVHAEVGSPDVLVIVDGRLVCQLPWHEVAVIDDASVGAYVSEVTGSYVVGDWDAPLGSDVVVVNVGDGDVVEVPRHLVAVDRHNAQG
jgi:hypothetical protein